MGYFALDKAFRLGLASAPLGRIVSVERRKFRHWGVVSSQGVVFPASLSYNVAVTRGAFATFLSR